MTRVRRAGSPPAAGEYVPVWRIKTREPRQFVILSPVIWAYVVHWASGRTVPCTSLDSEYCRCPFSEWPQKWLGYVKAYEVGKHVGFVELTPGTANKIVGSLDEGISLRGHCFQFWRSSTTKGARHLVQLVPHITRSPAELPPDSDPEELLVKLWNAPKRTSM